MSSYRATRDRESGFVAAELSLGVALLLVPVACLVLTLPTWSERRTTARAIAREVARTVAGAGWCDNDSAESVAQMMERNLGLGRRDIHLDLGCWPGAPLDRGGDLGVGVTVRMPAVTVPGLGHVGSWSWTARQRQPVDVYGSDR